MLENKMLRREKCPSREVIPTHSDPTQIHGCISDFRESQHSSPPTTVWREYGSEAFVSLLGNVQISPLFLLVLSSITLASEGASGATGGGDWNRPSDVSHVLLSPKVLLPPTRPHPRTLQNVDAVLGHLAQ